MSVVGFVPHFEFLSLRIILFLVATQFIFDLLAMRIRQCSVQCDTNMHRVDALD